jgi:threonine dehydratase
MMDFSSLPVTAADVEVAAKRIAPYIRQTPMMTLPTGTFGIDATLTFKLEFMQHAGSFKPRGAFNSLLTTTVPPAGVAAASGGNHGAAVAYAAQQLGVHATIFVPEISSLAKIAAIRQFGADVRIGGALYNDALDACNHFVLATGASAVHAFDTHETIAGQGTLAREWGEQLQARAPHTTAPYHRLDTVLVAVGGGGLIAGIAAYWENKGIKVVGVEPMGSCALYRALQTGGPVDVEVQSVAADSLGARRAGSLAYDIAKQAVAEVVLVDDAAILAAQGILWRDFRVASEPGGATALAALLSKRYIPSKGEHVGVLLCGANVSRLPLGETDV